METVKVQISLGELSIQMEGPEAFVGNYLQEYGPMINWYRRKIATPTVTNTPSKTVDGNSFKLDSSSLAGLSCGKRIQKLISNGYFQEPKTSTDVFGWLNENGARHDICQVSGVLSRFAKKGSLNRSKEGRAYNYTSSLAVLSESMTMQR